MSAVPPELNESAQEQAYLNSLKNQWRDGNQQAGAELSLIALGGNGYAAKLVEAVDAEGVVITNVIPGESKKGITASDVLFAATHPVLAIRAAVRQVEVGMEVSGPPSGQTIEDFANSPLPDAMRAIRQAELRDKEKQAQRMWGNDLGRLKNGQPTRGYPPPIDEV